MKERSQQISAASMVTGCRAVSAFRLFFIAKRREPAQGSLPTLSQAPKEYGRARSKATACACACNCMSRMTIASSSLLRLRSEEHTSELQSRGHLVCRLLLEKKKKRYRNNCLWS